MEEMTDYMFVNGKQFYSEDLIIKSMVDSCIEESMHKGGVYVCSTESDHVYAYENLLNKIEPSADVLEHFRKEYVKRRFMERVGL